MKVTALTNEKYIPLCMSGGRDAILLGYDGSNFVSHNGHAHMETHQGAQTGWYKSASKHPMEFMQPSLMAGIQVLLNGAYVVPTFYEQEFLPKDATLTTTLDFRCGIKLRITSFFTYDDCIWGEKFEVLECPEDINASIGFRASRPYLSERLKFIRESDASFKQDSDKSFEITYVTGDHTGRGALITGEPFGSYRESRTKFADQCYAEVLYNNITKGFSASRTMILLGDNETHISYGELRARAERGFEALHKEHIALWNKYFASSSVCFNNNDELTELFYMSEYLMKAHQHPESGIVTLGMLPYHWRGASTCSWDEEKAHEALLACGHFGESELYCTQYQKQAAEGYRILKERGYEGLAFSGWTTLAGEFCGHRPIEEWLTTFKPTFSAYAIVCVYNEWRRNPSFNAEDYRQICIDVLKHFLSSMISKGEGGLYFVKPIKDSAERGTTVEIDTGAHIILGRVFSYVGEMFAIQEYADIAEGLFSALEENRMDSGDLALAKGSPYPSSPIEYYIHTLERELISPEVLHRSLEAMRTPWGYDTGVDTEEKRHWPWYDTQAVRAYAAAKMPREAYTNLKHIPYGRTSLYALPEFIRLDGVGIGYYYTTPHAFVITAVIDSMLQKSGNELRICFGLLREVGDFSADGVWIDGKIRASIKVECGKIVYLSLENGDSEDAILSINVNPEFDFDGIPRRVKIPAGETLEFGN